MLHELKYLHNDVKPDNIVIGNDDPDKIYLIDFGISTRYLDCHGNHLKKKDTKRFRGSFLFASLSVSQGYSPSRRDDIQSAFFVLIYLLNG